MSANIKLAGVIYAARISTGIRRILDPPSMLNKRAVTEFLKYVGAEKKDLVDLSEYFKLDLELLNKNRIDWAIDAVLLRASSESLIWMFTELDNYFDSPDNVFEDPAAPDGGNLSSGQGTNSGGHIEITDETIKSIPILDMPSHE